MRRNKRSTNPLIGSVLTCCVLAFIAAGTFPRARADETAKANDARIVQDFETRASRYVAERRKQSGSSPRRTNSADKLDSAQHDIAQKSKLARAEAERGEIFSPEIAVYFRRQVAATMAGPQGVKVRTSLHHAEPVKDVPLRVNEVYPRGLPLQSMPASLLMNLPPLPKELQYRIVGRNLVLLDVAPKLIVDFVPDAIASE